MEDDRELTELDERTCRRLLERHHFGRVAVNDDDGPVVLPVNYTVQQGSVVFRTGTGTKLDAAVSGDAACFEIDDVDEERRLGWSVVVRGRLEEITDSDERVRIEEEMIEPFAPGRRDHLIRVLARSVTGRRIPIPSSIPEEWFERADLGNIWYGRDASDLLG